MREVEGRGRQMRIAGGGPRALMAEQFLDNPQRDPRSNKWVAQECRSVWTEASLGMPLWRTTALKVLWREVGARGAGCCRAGNNQGRVRARCQYARNNSRTRGASGTQRSFLPLAWR